MKNSRRGFSFIEVLLVLIIAGLLAAVFIPAAVKIRQDVRLEYIEENLDKIIEAGQLGKGNPFNKLSRAGRRQISAKAGKHIGRILR